MPLSSRTRVLPNLAAAFLSGAWTVADLRNTAFRATGKRLRWVALLSNRALAQFPARPDFESLLSFLDQDAGVNRASRAMERDGYLVRTIFIPPVPKRAPPAALAALDLPAFANSTALAAWLGLTPGWLDWLADPSGRNRLHDERLRTYRYRWVPKPHGRSRLLEIPKPLLKQVQRKLLDDPLIRIPTHPRARFRLDIPRTNAAAHCGRDIVLRFDLTTSSRRFPSGVFALFATLGYPRWSRLLRASARRESRPSVEVATESAETVPVTRPGNGSARATSRKRAASPVSRTWSRFGSTVVSRLSRPNSTRPTHTRTTSPSPVADRARSGLHIVAVIAGEEGFTQPPQDACSARRRGKSSPA